LELHALQHLTEQQKCNIAFGYGGIVNWDYRAQVWLRQPEEWIYFNALAIPY